MTVALLIAGLVIAIVVLVVVPLVLVVRKRSRQIRTELATNLQDESVVRGPENGLYRGGNGIYPKVKGNGVIVLTRERLIFRMLVGKGVDIPVGDLVGTHESKGFEGSITGGKVHLVVETTAGEVGFFVDDNAAWAAAIGDAISAPP